jgi:CDGSH-type Zn-finger protein
LRAIVANFAWIPGRGIVRIDDWQLNPTPSTIHWSEGYSNGWHAVAVPFTGFLSSKSLAKNEERETAQKSEYKVKQRMKALTQGNRHFRSSYVALRVQVLNHTGLMVRVVAKVILLLLCRISESPIPKYCDGRNSKLETMEPEGRKKNDEKRERKKYRVRSAKLNKKKGSPTTQR